MDVLIVEDEPALLESLQDGLRGAFPGYNFRGAASVEAAELLLQDDVAPLLIVTDIRLPGRSGVEFLVDVQHRWPEVRFIVMSAFPSTVPSEITGGSGMVRFLRKPFELARLVGEVREALEAKPFRGNVEGITLVDLLQILHMGNRSATLKVRRGSQAGEIVLRDGEIVHAELDDQKGVAAFNRIVTWRGGGYSLESATAAIDRPTIEESFSFLLLEAMRLMDEQDRLDPENEAPDGARTKEDVMADLNELCKQLVEEVPDAVASNVIDLGTGMMLGGYFLSNFTTDHFEAVSAAATNLYRGRETLRVENLVKAQRGDTSDDHFMQEVQFSTTRLHHFLVKLPDKDAVLTLVTKKPGNIGMGWAAVRGAMGKVALLVPS